jgi:hypothetical protein
MFVMNLQTWRGDPYIEAHHAPAEIDALERELTALAARESSASSITFGRRRLVFARH